MYCPAQTLYTILLCLVRRCSLHAVFGRNLDFFDSRQGVWLLCGFARAVQSKFSRLQGVPSQVGDRTRSGSPSPCLRQSGAVKVGLQYSVRKVHAYIRESMHSPDIKLYERNVRQYWVPHATSFDSNLRSRLHFELLSLRVTPSIFVTSFVSTAFSFLASATSPCTHRSFS